MNISLDFLKPVTSNLRKYTSLMPSVIIMIVALLLFIPTLVVGNKVRQEMKKSVQYAGTVSSLLADVPSRNEPEQVKIYMDKLEAELNQIKTLAQQSSQRELVTYDYVIFPEPVDRSSQIYVEFGKQYRSAIEALIKQMNALDAPSENEIRAKTGSPRRTGMAAYGMPRTAGLSDDPMVDALCISRAQEISVYANPSAFSWYDFWEKYEFSGRVQALEDCWDSQVACWIYEDVVDTIQKMNGQTAKVVSVPVKRLLGISFTGPVTAGTQEITRGYYREGLTAGRDIPNYVTSLLPSNFLAASPTGRRGNEDYDIIHFAVSVLIENRAALAFMKELCTEKPHTFRVDFKADGQQVQGRHNQITILESDLKSIDKTSPDHELYRYGNAPVLRLDLVCEYQLYRAGYDTIKPEPIKKRLGQETAAETGSQTQPGMPGGMDPMMY